MSSSQANQTTRSQNERETKKEEKKKGKAIQLPDSSHLLPLLGQSLSPELLGLLHNPSKQQLATELLPHTVIPDGGEGVKVSKSLDRQEVLLMLSHTAKAKWEAGFRR